MMIFGCAASSWHQLRKCGQWVAETRVQSRAQCADGSTRAFSALASAVQHLHLASRCLLQLSSPPAHLRPLLVRASRTGQVCARDPSHAPTHPLSWRLISALQHVCTRRFQVNARRGPVASVRSAGPGCVLRVCHRCPGHTCALPWPAAAPHAMHITACGQQHADGRLAVGYTVWLGTCPADIPDPAQAAPMLAAWQLMCPKAMHT